ncbi:hypothetical protein [Paraburkholderia bannensis]|uniref:hypothetical protein n=1 Tax=Paraburkholderia bannensis TaxID=765414 RepID=UPI002AB7C802|nr:hypothetical protein [Paraburkholderia bannensis]
MQTVLPGMCWPETNKEKMKIILRTVGITLAAASFHAQACKVFLQDNIELPHNAIDVRNVDRLVLTRHYLTAKEWTKEGATAQVEATAFDSENNPKELATSRRKSIVAFLMQLGLSKDDIFASERIIKLKKGKIDPDDKWQIGVEFVPKCSPSGCQSLCNTPRLSGVVSYAVTADTPGPSPDSLAFTCGDQREPAKASVLRSETWTPRTEEKELTLEGDTGLGKRAPLAGICYRITTSAREYIGMTDTQGHTARIQLLGPEYTTIEMKVDADRYGVSGGY